MRNKFNNVSGNPDLSFTVAPPRVVANSATPNDPEFGRLPRGREHDPNGLTRAYLYQLIKEGKIRSVSLRKKGCIRGVRLIYLPSLKAYLNSKLEEQTAQGGGTP